MVAATAKAQLVKETTQISEQESLQLTRNLLRIAIFNISYIRGLFPEKYFEDKFVPALEMKIKKLLPLDVESRRLIDWMEKGVYDALQKRYLKTLLFGLCDIEDGPLVEEYDFSFFYPNDSSDDVTMVLNKNGNKSHVNSFSTKSYDLTPTQMKISACKMVRTLVQLMRTLNHIPDERTIIMKLHYYDDITPEDYEPPYFRSCTYEDKIPWSRVPLKMKVGEVNSKHFAIALKVRSILDPCEDENEAKNSKNGLMTSSSDSEASSSSEESEEDGHQKVTQNRTGQVSDAAAAVSEGKTSQQLADNQGEDSENTEDTATEAENLERLKQWLLSRATNRIEMCDVLSDFPDISMVHIEELMNCLIKDGFLKSLGRDLYEVKQVEEEVKEVESLNKEKYLEKAPLMTNNLNEVEEKTMYMKALYHALPLEYVSVAQLQSKLQGEVNQSTARKLMDKMAIDGFIEETASNRRMGRRVMHTAETQKKLQELQTAFTADCKVSKLGTSVGGPHFEGPIAGSSNASKRKEGSSDREKDGSTFGRFHTMGSEVTRHGQSDRDASSGSATLWPNSSGFKRPNSPGKHLHDPSKPAMSRESTVFPKHAAYGAAGSSSGCKKRPGSSQELPNPKTDTGTEIKGSQDTIDSTNLLDGRLRKASTVKDPIYQTNKRLRSASEH